MLLLLSALALAPPASADDGKVTLPLDSWQELLDRVDETDDPTLAPVPVLQVDRSVEGAFRRGVFTGTLVTRISVPPGARDLRVPVLDATASIAAVQLDGRTTSLLPESGSYTVAIDAPGLHTVRIDFFVGREDDRFARRLQLALPPAGPTRLAVWVPEVDIEADVSQGAVTALRSEGAGTRIEGQLDGRGGVDVTWKGRTAQTLVPVKMEAKEYALFTLHEALVRGVAQIDATVLEGETDRVVLQLPADVEIVDVQGDAVLQWQTEAGQLVVLLRYLVTDDATLRVQFQYPVDLDRPVELRLPVPTAGVAFSGAIGVQGPAGLVAEVKSSEHAETLRDLPSELAALTAQPLLLGFEFRESPTVTLGVTRQAEVELTTTIVDSLEAATVLIEDGAEITKVQLRVRNNSRQYLSARLPEGAVLTHARIDGRPVRPAESGDALLFPLVQSTRLEEGGSQIWTVRDGDTLGGIADRFYSDPGQWSSILDGNRDQLGSPIDLAPGQTLRIPARKGLAVRESSFVIELAWTRRGDPMGWLGRRSLSLPELDADVVEATWHVFVPDALLPLSFSANLTQYSDIRYDHFRRLRQFFGAALGIRNAWAGMPDSGYENILSRRKSIYQQESTRASTSDEATGSFPLVGERYRFKRLLPGREVATLSVTWMTRSFVPAVRWLSFAAAIGLALSWLGGRRRPPLLAGIAGLLVVAWYVEGVHRRLLWGIDAALILTLLQSGRLRLPSRSALLDRLSFRSLAVASAAVFGVYVLLAFPLLWSTTALAVLAWRVRRTA